MLGPASTRSDSALFYSPTPMKRRSAKNRTTKEPTRRSSQTLNGAVANNIRGALDPDVIKEFSQDLDDSSKRSNQDSLSPTLASTVAMEDSDSDSERSFFDNDIADSPKQLEDESQKKSKKKKKKLDKSGKSKSKKKKREKSDSSKKNLDKSETPKKKNLDKSDKSTKSKKKSGKSKKKREKSEKSTIQSAIDSASKECDLFKTLQVSSKELNESESESSFLGDAFDESDYIVPLSEKQEQDISFRPPLWAESDDEKSFGGTWEEDQTWNGWDEDREENKSQYIEETVCDDDHDGFSYYSIQSNDNLNFPEVDENIADWNEEAQNAKANRRVRFDDSDTIHNMLHICDFTKKEIRGTWYQQKDYEETIQGVRQAASSSETPRDTQTRMRRKRSTLSKSADTRGLEAWTPSGVQRFRYVKEAAFRAVWDEQQKQLDDGNEDDNNGGFTDSIENVRNAYLRVSINSQKEAQQRAKRDEEIAAKLQPRRRSLQRSGSLRGGWGSSARNLMDGLSKTDASLPTISPTSVSDLPVALPSCLRKRESVCETESNKEAWFGEPARGVARGQSEQILSRGKLDRGLSRQTSDRNLFKQRPERGLFKQASDRGLFKQKPDRGLFKQKSDRNIFQPKTERPLFRQTSNRGLFKQRIKEESASNRNLFKKKIIEESERSISQGKQKPDRGLSRQISKRGLSFRQKLDRGLARNSSERGIFRQKSDRSLGRRSLHS